ncbi:MAG: HAD family hydrolase [Nitrososphaerales archaeon]|nr:HAD family hydrolase [Nitrososphaerales archaeon]
MIKAVLFDYGGTLVTSAKPWQEMKPRALLAAYRYLKQDGLEMSFKKYLGVNDGVFGRYAELEAASQRDIPDRLKYLDMVGVLFPDSTKKRKLALASGANDSFWRVANDNFKLRRDAKACLGKLDAMGLKLGIVSNHHDSRSLIRSLRQYGIKPWFDPIVVSESVKVRKPNPAIFRLCLSAMKVKPRDALFVGDSMEHDVAGARATGMPVVQIGGKDADGPKPDFVVDHLAAIPGLVASMSERGELD